MGTLYFPGHYKKPIYLRNFSQVKRLTICPNYNNQIRTSSVSVKENIQTTSVASTTRVYQLFAEEETHDQPGKRSGKEKWKREVEREVDYHFRKGEKREKTRENQYSNENVSYTYLAMNQLINQSILVTKCEVINTNYHSLAQPMCN